MCSNNQQKVYVQNKQVFATCDATNDFMYMRKREHIFIIVIIIIVKHGSLTNDKVVAVKFYVDQFYNVTEKQNYS